VPMGPSSTMLISGSGHPGSVGRPGGGALKERIVSNAVCRSSFPTGDFAAKLSNAPFPNVILARETDRG
jgi:hypothetical protein